LCWNIYHPSSPPERTPNGIKDNLQIMIKEAIKDNDVTTSGTIIQGN